MAAPVTLHQLSSAGRWLRSPQRRAGSRGSPALQVTLCAAESHKFTATRIPFSQWTGSRRWPFLMLPPPCRGSRPRAMQHSLSAKGVGESWGGGGGAGGTSRGDRHSLGSRGAGQIETVSGPAQPGGQRCQSDLPARNRLEQRFQTRALCVVPRGGHVGLRPSVASQKTKQVLCEKARPWPQHPVSPGRSDIRSWP